jgi:hypothetical protein
MVTAHPVPHHKENPDEGDNAGAQKRAARGWGIVCGRPRD